MKKRTQWYEAAFIAADGRKVVLDKGLRFRRFDLLGRWAACWDLRRFMRTLHWHVPGDGLIYISQGEITPVVCDGLIAVDPHQPIRILPVEEEKR